MRSIWTITPSWTAIVMVPYASPRSASRTCSSAATSASSSVERARRAASGDTAASGGGTTVFLFEDAGVTDAEIHGIARAQAERVGATAIELGLDPADRRAGVELDLLLIVERLLDDDGAGPLPAVMQSLNMLVCTEGRERTPAEYEALLRAAGFREVGFRGTGTPRDAVLARK